MKRNIRVLLIVLVVLALAGGTFAFAASNTVNNPGKAGEGSSTEVAGYVVNNITYNLATDKANLTSVEFSTDEIATQVYVKLDSTSVNWYLCETTAVEELDHGKAWTCATTSPQLQVVDIDIVDVAAASQ